LKQKKYSELFQNRKASGYILFSFQEWHINVWHGAIKLQDILLEHQQLSNYLSVSFYQTFFFFQEKRENLQKTPDQQKKFFLIYLFVSERIKFSASECLCLETDLNVEFADNVEELVFEVDELFFVCFSPCFGLKKKTNFCAAMKRKSTFLTLGVPLKVVLTLKN
jgi:hypothetical protein